MKTLNFDDGPHTLKFTPNAIADFESVSGKSLFSVVTQDFPGVSDVRGLLWAGLKEGDRKFTSPRTGLILAGGLIEKYPGGFEALSQEIFTELAACGWLGIVAEVKDGDGSGN